MILGGFLLGWIAMLILGVLHHEVFPQVPPLGYWPTTGLTFGVLIIGGIIRWAIGADKDV